MTLFFVSFLAGVLTVLSPCVLPLLPVAVGGSLAGGRSVKRAATVVAALGISVFAFTFLLKVSALFIAVPQSFWNWLSGGILFLVGVFFIFPHLWDLVPGTARANRASSQLMSAGFVKQSFWGDVLVGAALGPVFSSCSPTYFIVLATVLPVSLAAGVTDILAYVLGLCFFLFMIAVAGQRVMKALGVAADPNGWLRKILGLLFVTIAVLIVTGALARVEVPLYNVFDATKLEQKLIPSASPAAAPMPGAVTTAPSSTLTLAEKAAKYEKAPELVFPDAYLNTGGQPITLSGLRGKVVLVDFWTYSCINCQRTLPYLTSWYKKYKDQGLVVVGVHTPEFSFEHVEENVVAALKQFDITYPVVLDNEYRTWNAFGNQYWPHEYLIDTDGFIVHDHIGEGGYPETESAIQAALAERAAREQTGETIATTTVAIVPADLSGIASPETYFGASRNELLGNGMQGQAGAQTLALPAAQQANTLYLGGIWNFASEYATNTNAGAEVEYTYRAKNVYFVASAAASETSGEGSGQGKSILVEVIQDGMPLKTITVSASTLYPLISNAEAGVHTLKLIVTSPGLQAYTLTFG